MLYIDQSLFATRKIYDSVGLIKIPSLENVGVYLNNSLIGKTNQSGEILAPSLLNFTQTAIRINEQDVPINAQLTTEIQSFFIPAPGAYAINFTTQQGENKIFKVLLDDNSFLQPGSIIEWSDEKTTVVGYNSEIYRSLPTSSQELTGVLYSENNICHIKLDSSKNGQMNVSDCPILVCKSSLPKPVESGN